MSAEPVSDDTRPTPGLPPLVLESGFKQVRTNSVEHDAFAAMGWTVSEQDGTTTILQRPARRASDRRVTGSDILRWRELERGALEQIAAELRPHGVEVTADQLRWAMDQFRARIMHEAGRFQVNGRAR